MAQGKQHVVVVDDDFASVRGHCAGDRGLVPVVAIGGAGRVFSSHIAHGGDVAGVAVYPILEDLSVRDVLRKHQRGADLAGVGNVRVVGVGKGPLSGVSGVVVVTESRVTYLQSSAVHIVVFHPDGAHLLVVVEGVLADLRHRSGNGDSGKAGVVAETQRPVEGVAADGGQPVGQLQLAHLTESVVGEGVVAEDGDRAGNVDVRQSAVVKGVAGNFRQPFAQDHFAQHLAAVEGILPQVCNAGQVDGTLQVVTGVEGVFAHPRQCG